MKIVFFGTPAFAVPALQLLIDRQENIAAVVTQPDRPCGRGRSLRESPVKTLALQHGLPVLQPEKVRAPGFAEWFADCRPEIAVVVAFGQLFPGSLLAIPPRGFINIHASLLPVYRGAAPINHAVMDGCTETGTTIMQLDTGMDTGDILLQERMPIDPADTAATLHDRLAIQGARLLGTALDGLQAGTISPVSQDRSRAISAPMLTKADGWIDWSLPAETIVNRIRGMTPWPGCVTLLGDRQLKVHRAGCVPGSGGVAGEVLRATGGEITVAAGSGVVQLQEVQFEGKRRMQAADFLKGCPLAPGIRLHRPDPENTY